ncbi:MAG: BON domain-containing protein [Rickettsiales bacterium]|jgi:osmotically-inducible protein OsmY|nr:BON domain-containing protein [Rickettsiales bacterium]
MKKAAGALAFILSVSCSAGFVAKTNDAIIVSTDTFRTVGQISRDEKTRETIKTLIRNNQDIFLKLNKQSNVGSYEVLVFNNVAMVVGTVYNQQSIDFIVRNIRKIPHVTEVINELFADEKPNRQVTKDFIIVKGIESKLKVKKSIKTINYEIAVVNGRAYVIGVVKNNEELELLTKSISTVKGVTEVVSYVSVIA